MILVCNSIHNCFSILIFSILLIFGCQKRSEKNSVQSGAASSDSVLFTIKTGDYKAIFTEVDKPGKGVAKGDYVFQRRGSLDYILGELYNAELITIKNNLYTRKNFKIDVNWSKRTDFKTIKPDLIEKIQHNLGYTTSFDSVKVKAYELNITDKKKLDKAKIKKNKLPNGVNFKINTQNNILNIIATLPRTAKTISKTLDKRIVSVPDSINHYQFELDLTSDIIHQLNNKYGLTLTPTQKSFRKMIIHF